MEFNLFGLKLGGKNRSLQSVEDTKKAAKSFVLPQADDDSVTIEAAGGFFGQTLDMDGTTRTDTELIYRYRDMSMHQEVETAIDNIIGDAIVLEDNVLPVKLSMENLEGYSEGVKRKFVKEFNEILRLLKFQTKGYEIFRRWYVDSKIVFHIIVDEKHKSEGIVELRYVDPVNIQKVRLYHKKKENDGSVVITGIEEFYVYNKDGFKAGNAQGLRISPDAILSTTSGLFDSRSKRTVGYLHKAIKPLNQVRMMEDAVVIYRLSRAPERRIFYVDVGNLPKNKAEQYVRDLMNRHRNKLVYDAQTGEVRDDKRQMSMLEDYWMPRRDGSKGTEIDTLSGAQNLGELEDVKYFLKKLYKALNVPLSRMDSEQKSFSIGRTTEITRDEVQFSKFISRLRNKFSEIFYAALKTQLILKGIITPEEWDTIKDKIFFDYLKDSYFSELKRNELLNDRMNSLAAVTPFVGEYYSRSWIKKQILGQNDEEIELMSAEMAIEKDEDEKEMLRQMEAGLPFKPPAGTDPSTMPMDMGMGAGGPPGAAPAGGAGKPPANPQSNPAGPKNGKPKAKTPQSKPKL